MNESKFLANFPVRISYIFQLFIILSVVFLYACDPMADYFGSSFGTQLFSCYTFVLSLHPFVDADVRSVRMGKDHHGI